LYLGGWGEAVAVSERFRAKPRGSLVRPVRCLSFYNLKPQKTGVKSMSTDPMFRITIADVFSIRGRGTVVTGCVEQGILRTGDVVELRGAGYTRQVVVRTIEKFHVEVGQAKVGEHVGLVLEAIAKDEIQRGDVLVGSERS
jgi:translation elongation factor EF-Tu-like GTPase